MTLSHLTLDGREYASVYRPAGHFYDLYRIDAERQTATLVKTQCCAELPNCGIYTRTGAVRIGDELVLTEAQVLDEITGKWAILPANRRVRIVR